MTTSTTTTRLTSYLGNWFGAAPAADVDASLPLPLLLPFYFPNGGYRTDRPFVSTVPDWKTTEYISFRKKKTSGRESNDMYISAAIGQRLFSSSLWVRLYSSRFMHKSVDIINRAPSIPSLNYRSVSQDHQSEWCNSNCTSRIQRKKNEYTTSLQQQQQGHWIQFHQCSDETLKIES